MWVVSPPQKSLFLGRPGSLPLTWVRKKSHECNCNPARTAAGSASCGATHCRLVSRHISQICEFIRDCLVYAQNLEHVVIQMTSFSVGPDIAANPGGTTRWPKSVVWSPRNPAALLANCDHISQPDALGSHRMTQSGKKLPAGTLFASPGARLWSHELGIRTGDRYLDAYATGLAVSPRRNCETVSFRYIMRSMLICRGPGGGIRQYLLEAEMLRASGWRGHAGRKP